MNAPLRTLDVGLQAALDAGVTTLCRCWRIDRRDGAVVALTDCDRSVSFEGATFHPMAGEGAAAFEAAEGLAVDNAEVVGALSSDAIEASDIARGRFDRARIRAWRVDWVAPERRVLLFDGRIGEIRRQGAQFSAELRGLSEALNRPQGRSLTPLCDAELGDSRCGVNLSDVDHRREVAVVSAISPRAVSVSGLDSLSSGWASRGRYEWLSGPNQGDVGDVKAHRLVDGAHVLEFWSAPFSAMSAGETLRVTIGCDKTFETCGATFANRARFRGFPHIPGDDWIAVAPRTGDVNDGGSRNA